MEIRASSLLTILVAGYRYETVRLSGSISIFLLKIVLASWVMFNEHLTSRTGTLVFGVRMLIDYIQACEFCINQTASIRSFEAVAGERGICLVG